MLKAGLIRLLADRWTRYILTKPPLLGGLLATTSRKPMRLRPPSHRREYRADSRPHVRRQEESSSARCRLQHAFLGSWPGVRLSVEECSYAGTPPGINHVQRTAS
jgi:hypothetical protein